MTQSAQLHPRLQVLAIGEVMVELAPVHGNAALRRLGYAGDTFNTAVYLSRLGVTTGYCTQLGDDLLSGEMMELMADEGIHTQYIRQLPGRTPGLYMISNAESGERTFSYWRGQSPARELFADIDSTRHLAAGLSHVDRVYFSGISLGILSEPARQRLFNVLREYRQQGGQVVFDSNYRAQLWPNPEAARCAMLEALACSHTALLTDSDELTLWRDDLQCTLERCAQQGVSELIIKRGAEPVWVAERDRLGALTLKDPIPVPPVAQVVDTTAAGDSFNAGYLAARLAGQPLQNAVSLGNRCAAVVIQQRGAIIDRCISLPTTHPI